MARIAPLNIDWKPDRTTGEPVTEQIVGYMCEQVHSGNWPIGSRLPSQRALAEWFGVNRSTVIAAINELPIMASSKGSMERARESSATRGR